MKNELKILTKPNGDRVVYGFDCLESIDNAIFLYSVLGLKPLVTVFKKKSSHADVLDIFTVQKETTFEYFSEVLKDNKIEKYQNHESLVSNLKEWAFSLDLKTDIEKAVFDLKWWEGIFSMLTNNVYFKEPDQTILVKDGFYFDTISSNTMKLDIGDVTYEIGLLLD